MSTLREWIAACALLAAAAAVARKQAAGDDEPRPPVAKGRPNVPTPTMGGKQVWGDEFCFQQWRVQRHALTGHYRLLDGDDRRHAWGSYEHCRQRLETMKQELGLPPMQGKVVIVLHGLFRTRSAMRTVGDYLADQGNYTALRVSYPSTRAGLDEHAAALAKIVEGLPKPNAETGEPGVERIDFVGHSLGNLVIRRFLHSQIVGENGCQPDPRLGRIVMLAPPNQRPKQAELWARSRWFGRAFRLVTGDVGMQLADGWEELAPKLATPRCEFGIVAGGKGDEAGWHEAVPGDDDGTVSVQETRLAGASDFLVMPVRHTFIMNDPAVLESALRFLDEGRFRQDGERAPIAD